MPRLFTSLIAASALAFLAPAAFGTVMITFANNDTFEGDSASSTAGPFTDLATGITATITTVNVIPDGVLNPNSGSLGFNADGSGDSASEFDSGEVWSFEWSEPVEFAGIDFSLGTDEEFQIQSDAWIGLSITPVGPVSFNSFLGTFTFPNSGTDDFDVTDLGGSAVLVPAGTDITITFAAIDVNDSAPISDMSFNIVPEPSRTLFLLAGATGIVLRRRRQ